MKICVIGTGYCRTGCGAGFADMGNGRHLLRHRTRKKTSPLKAGPSAYLRNPAWNKLIIPQRAGRPTRLHHRTYPPLWQEPRSWCWRWAPHPGPTARPILRYIFQAAETAARALSGWAVLVTKSTVPVGTGDKIEADRAASMHTTNSRLRPNPEFLKEGRCGQRLHEARFAVIVGTSDPRALATLQRLVTRPLPDRATASW